ncbi:phosphoheptose isomerase [Candidatus Saccharibacteria bacterium]|nr:phosphoheptose isomerase [Candidatus Saccharibacteria bacterium]
MVVNAIKNALAESNYKIIELNEQKPWGAYFRLDSTMTESFLADFFSGLTLEKARLGHKGAELSPKILLVAPGHRLSWQYHHRRAERWAFLTGGAFYRSDGDDEGVICDAKPGDIVQFNQAERHRLVGAREHYTIVAEIWQHTDSDLVSDEEDIVRLDDDYGR